MVVLRLLNVDTFELGEFNDELNEVVPRYAVASHRWEAEDDEAKTGDVSKGKKTAGVGYQKLEAFCHFVKTNLPHIHWLWIETCCVNRKDGLEVYDSVNMAWKWFHEAAVCLTFLRDVVADPVATHSRCISELTRSEWFSRSWMVPELLAPGLVIFLTSSWKVIGHKQDVSFKGKCAAMDAGPSLVETISNITDIPSKVLKDSSRNVEVSVSDRMAWTEKRAATFEEDRIYCLLGMFGVSNSLCYGQGLEKARNRLRATIDVEQNFIMLNKMPNMPQAAFDATEKNRSDVCQEGTRVDLLSKIDRWARDAAGKRMYWMTGLAGTGKTTLARTVASRLRARGRLAASFFFDRHHPSRCKTERLVTTIAHQFTRHSADLKDHISTILRANGGWNMFQRPLQEQFERLVVLPLSRMHDRTPRSTRPLFVVIDALDDCGSQHTTFLIINLFARCIPSHVPLRLFITTRPDLNILYHFSGLAQTLFHHDALHRLHRRVIAADMATMLRARFQQIRALWSAIHFSRAPLPLDWPGCEAIDHIVAWTLPSFADADAVAGYVARGDIELSLSTLMEMEDPRQVINEGLSSNNKRVTALWAPRPDHLAKQPDHKKEGEGEEMGETDKDKGKEKVRFREQRAGRVL